METEKTPIRNNDIRDAHIIARNLKPLFKAWVKEAMLELGAERSGQLKLQTEPPKKAPANEKQSGNDLLNEKRLTVSQAAERLQLTEAQVYTEVKRGSIPHIKVGKRIFIFERDCGRYLKGIYKL